MQPTSADRLEHIATAIRNVRKITKGQTRESFASDLVVRLAVERLLEVISEASRHISAEAKAQEPSIQLLWEMIENDLEPLDKFARRVAK